MTSTNTLIQYGGAYRVDDSHQPQPGRNPFAAGEHTRLASQGCRVNTKTPGADATCTRKPVRAVCMRRTCTKSGLVMLVVSTLGSLMGWAQKPVSTTITKPGNLTVTFDPHQKMPTLNLPCKMANGVDDRPFACEFRLDKVEFIGNDGVSLGSTTAKTHLVPLPFGKAKKKPLAGQNGPITYAAKVYFTRINKPTFPVQKGYLIQSCLGPFCVDAQPDQITSLAKNLQISTDIGTQTVVPFDISWTYTKGQEVGVAFSLFVENDVTTNALKPKPGTVLDMRDKAEASIIVSPLVKIP